MANLKIILLLLFLPACFASSMIFIAHSDDEIIGATSVLTREDNITIILFTDGAPEEYNLTRHDEIIREHEHGEALSLLNKSIKLIEYEYDDYNFYKDLGSWGLFLKVLNVTRTLNLHCPDKLYVHAFEAGHVDHDTVHYIVRKAWELSNCNNPLIEFVEYNPLGWGVPLYNGFNKTILTSGELELKQEMLSCFLSQEVYKNCTTKEECEQSVLNTYYFSDEYFRLVSDYDYVNPEYEWEDEDFYKTLSVTNYLLIWYKYRWWGWLFLLILIFLKNARRR